MLSALLREWWFTNNIMWLGEGGWGREDGGGRMGKGGWKREDGGGRMGEMEKGKRKIQF